MNGRLLSIALSLLLASCGADGVGEVPRGDVTVDAPTSGAGGPEIDLELLNTSNHIISFPEEPLLGYAVSSPGIRLVVFREEVEIQACAHVDPPPRLTMRSLAPGETFYRSPDVGLIKKIYCLKRGYYYAAIEYEDEAGHVIRGGLAKLEIE